jgi:hypothetical protein
MALQSNDAAANGFNSAVRDAWLSANYMSLFTQRSPIFKMLQMRGRIKPSGYGTKMREPLLVPVLTGPQLEGVTNAYADRSPQPMTGYTTAEYDLSEYIIDVSWQDYDDRKAGGDVEMVQWREAHFKNALERSNNRIMRHLWAAPEDPNSIGVRQQVASIRTFINGGTTSATDGGNLDLPAQATQSKTPYVGTTGATAQLTIGNIPRNVAGAAYWCSCLLGTEPTQEAFTILVMNNIYEEAFQEGYEPNLILLPSALFSKLNNLITIGGSNGGQVYGESSLAKVGFSSIKFRNAEIVVDRRVPTSGYLSGTSTQTLNQCFCLNVDMLKLRMNAKKPAFKEVPTNKPIQEHVGQWFMALTAAHLGNVHALHGNLTT